jgi:hypothetical protein
MLHRHVSPFGGVVLLVPDSCYPAGDQRIVRPTRRKEARRARV